MPHIKNALIRYRVIDKLLCSKGKPYPSKADLRQACEEELYGDGIGDHISDSTVEKDLFAMRNEMDAPIAYSNKYRGYHYTDPDFSLNEKPLSEDDLSSIQFALSTLSQFKETTIFQQFGLALDKIIDNITIQTKSKNKNNDQFIQFEKRNSTTGNEYLEPLLSAIRKGYITYFDYESFISQDKKMRKVTPLLLKEYDNRWYLISYDLVKFKIITYGLDRMEDLEVVEEKGEQPENFDSDHYFKHAIGITANPDELPTTIIFEAKKIASKYIATQPFHSSQEIIEETAEKVTFSLFATISEELIRGMLSYGGDLEVKEPEKLRLEIRRRVMEMYENYK